MAGIQIDGVNNKIDFDDDLDTSISANTDDTLVIEAGGNTMATITSTAFTINDGTIITTADTSTTLTLKSTNAGASAGPRMVFERDSASPADSDQLGLIMYFADNDAGESTNFVEIKAYAEDVSDGTEDAQYTIDTMLAGSLRERVGFGPVATVFNDDSQDLDFRVESNDFSHMLFVDAGLNEVMVGGNGEQAAHFSVQNGTTDERAQVITCTNASYTGIALDMGVSRNTTNGTYHFLKMQRRGFAFSLICTDGGTITTTNNSYGAISDQRLKSNITDASSQWDDIKALKVRNYKMLQDPDQTTQIGVISQELETAGMNGLINESVADEYQIAYVDDESVLKAGDKVKEVKYSVLYMKAIKALQEAQTRIETLETKVAALEG